MVYVDNSGKFVAGKDLSAVTNFDSSNAIETIVRTANATTYTLTTVAGASSTLATPIAAGTAGRIAYYTDAYNVGQSTISWASDTLTVPGSIVPSTNNARALGTTSLRWSKLYLGSANSYGSAYVPIWWNNGLPQAVTDNKMIVNLGAHTAGESDTYAASIWREKPRPGVYGILPTAGGGTGNNSWTANRLVYSNTATKLTSTAIVSDGNYLSKITYLTINGNHQTTYRLWTDGAARIARNLVRLDSAPEQGDLVLSALGYKTGYPVYVDPTFKTGANSVGLYNNNNSSAPYTSVTRMTYVDAGLAYKPGMDSDYVIRIQNTGTGTSPNLGGFVQTISARANAEFIQIFRALIPVGYYVVVASNSMGSSYQDTWLTDTAGTGKWEWYARRVLCGATGTMSSGGHVSLASSNTTNYPYGTTDAPVTWYLSYCNCYDITKAEYDGLVTRFADAAHTSTNTNGVAYYINTTGTFGNIRTANGAFYSTGQDVTPKFGILPTAQGGSGNNSFTAQRLVYNPTATQMASAGKLVSNGNYLHIVNTDDISGTAASTNAPFAVGDLSNQHIVMDNNEIISKSSSTGSGTLNLQSDGGYIHTGASLGINGSDANFSLYVNGASRFNGNVLINMTEHTQFKLITGSDNTQTVYTPVLNVNGKMRLTDTLAIPANHRAIEFRPDNASYNSYIYYATTGNEALNFVHRSSVTSFIFWTGNRVESASNWYLQDDGSTARTDNPAVQIKQNSLYVNKLIPSGTNTLAQFYVNGFSIIGKEALDNTAFTNTLMITANQSSESGGEAFTETKPSWGITFRRQWNNGTMNTTSAGIYAVGVASWRAGLAFRTKTNTTNTGSHDTTAMWLSPEGRVGIGTTNPEQKVHINGGYLYIYNNAKGIKIGAENGSWIHFVAGADFWFNRAGSIQGHWRPYGDNTYDLGTTDNRWRNLYLSGGIRTQSQQALYVGSQQRSRWYKITLPEHGQSNINPSDAVRYYMHSMTIVVGGDYNNNPRGQIELKYYIYWNKTSYSFDKCYANAWGPDIDKVKIYSKIAEPFIIYIDTSNAYSSIWVEHLHGLDSASSYSTLNTKVETQADITIDSNYSPMPMVYLGTTSDLPTVWKTWNDFNPASNNTYYLGSTSLAWKQIFSNGIAVNNAGTNNNGGISLYSNMNNVTSYGIAMRASSAHGWVTTADSDEAKARAYGMAAGDATGTDWAIRFYNTGSKRRGFQWLHGGGIIASLNGYGYMQVNRLGLNRTGDNANGRIYWYSPAFYTWVTYMSNPGDGIAPHGGRPSVLGSVTSWAMRTLIENASGYGWVWESATNAVAAAATTPTPLMALNSNDGTLFLNGDMIISSTSGEQDRSLIFGYKNNTTQTQAIGASWRIVHKASGSGNANYFAIETTGSATGNNIAWVNTLRIGMNQHEGTFNGNWLPQTTAVFDLGAPSQRWNNLYLQGNLVMQDVGTPSAYAYVSNKITWTGGTDGAQLYYQIDSADAGRLMINTTDDANCLVAMAYNGTAKAYFANATPSFYPATNNTGSLGISGYVWNAIYVTGITATNLTLSGNLTVAGTSTFNGQVYLNSATHWKAGTNITCDGVTANGQEWSFDLTSGDYTGTYWHVWSGKNSASIIAAYNDDRHVTMPGNIASTSTTTGTLQVTGGIGVTGQVTAARLAAGGSNTSYTLYVNGTGLLINNLYVGNSSQTAERQVHVTSAAGDMYMYAQGSSTGNRGIYVPAHGSGSARGVFTVGTNNEVYFADGYNGTGTRLAYSQAGLAASAITWLTCWNGYELRAISKAEMANAVDSAHKFVRLAGDTMSGNLIIAKAAPLYRLVNNNVGAVASSNNNVSANTESSIQFYNSGTANWMGDFAQGYKTSGQIWARIYLRNYKEDGTTQVNNYIYLYANKDGTTSYAVANAAAFRTAIGISTSTSSGTAGRLAYYSTASNIAATGGLKYQTGSSTASTAATYTRLHIWGSTYGNTAGTMISGTAGLFSFGDGGPQITFDTTETPGGGQAGALIFTDHDTAATGASWHFVSNQGDWNVTSKRFHARTSISIGSNLPNTSYNFVLNGTANHTSGYWYINGGAGGIINGGATNGGINTMRVGDDVWIGDCNAGGIMGMKSTGGTCGIYLYNSSGTNIGQWTTVSDGVRFYNPASTNQWIYAGSDTASGQKGIYFPGYGGGWYMSDTTYIRNYGSKQVYINAQLGVNATLRLWTNTCQITRASRGVSWINGRDSALMREDDASGYHAVVMTKTGNGCWCIGNYNTTNWTNYLLFTYTTDSNYSAGTNTASANIRMRDSGVVESAMWNDYAEYRKADSIEAGRVVIETGNDDMTICNERLAASGKVISDTYGFAIGQNKDCQTPIAVSGRVLVYPFGDRNKFKPGMAVCTGIHGTVDIMTREEIAMYPERIVGTVSAVPTYEIWYGGGNYDENGELIPIAVNGRIWIYVR